MTREQAMTRIIEWLTRYGGADQCKICAYDKGGVICNRTEESCLDGMIAYFQEKEQRELYKPYLNENGELPEKLWHVVKTRSKYRNVIYVVKRVRFRSFIALLRYNPTVDDGLYFKSREEAIAKRDELRALEYGKPLPGQVTIDEVTE